MFESPRVKRSKNQNGGKKKGKKEREIKPEKKAEMRKIPRRNFLKLTVYI